MVVPQGIKKEPLKLMNRAICAWLADEIKMTAHFAPGGAGQVAPLCANIAAVPPMRRLPVAVGRSYYTHDSTPELRPFAPSRATCGMSVAQALQRSANGVSPTAFVGLPVRQRLHWVIADKSQGVASLRPLRVR